MRYIFSIIFAWLAASCAGTPQSSVRVELTQQQKADAEKAVIVKLKDPESARFGPLMATGTGNELEICGWVNAKNSFGGYTGFELYYIKSEAGHLRAFVEKDIAPIRCSYINLVPPLS